MHAPLNESPKDKTWLQKILKAEYFVIALLVHALIFIGFGGKVLFDAVTQKSAFEPGSIIVGGGEPGPPPPPPNTTVVEQVNEEVVVKTPTAVTEMEVIASDVMSDFTIPPPTIATPSLDVVQTTTQKVTQAVPKTNSFAARAAAVKDFTKDWGGGNNGSGGTGPVGQGKDVQAKFTCFIGKGGGTDPADSHELNDKGQITKGSIPNLLIMINAWSNGRVKAENVPFPLDLSSQIIFEKKPPFIYIAGYGDFKLTESEIKNLQKYLMVGGAIWGDSGLAGVGSKFDIAFRREMKLVVPDVDKPFERLPPDHAIYAGNTAFFQLKAQPAGMNFRNDPTEVIKIDDEIAVIYTPNNYTDMMQMAFNPPIKPAQNSTPNYVNDWGKKYPWGNARHQTMQHWENIYYFDNFTVESGEMTFRFGINIIVHLITRFQNKLLLAP